MNEGVLMTQGADIHRRRLHVYYGVWAAESAHPCRRGRRFWARRLRTRRALVNCVLSIYLHAHAFTLTCARTLCARTRSNCEGSLTNQKYLAAPWVGSPSDCPREGVHCTVGASYVARNTRPARHACNSALGRQLARMLASEARSDSAPGSICLVGARTPSAYTAHGSRLRWANGGRCRGHRVIYSAQQGASLDEQVLAAGPSRTRQEQRRSPREHRSAQHERRRRRRQERRD